MACSQLFDQSEPGREPRLRIAIVTALKAAYARFLTSPGPHSDEKVLALITLLRAVGAECRMTGFVNEQEPLDLDHEAVVILDPPEQLTPDVWRILVKAGYPRNFVLASGTPQLGPQASIATLLYPGIEDVGFIFWSRTRDAVQRPVLWIGGRSQAALQFAARFLLEGQLSPIRCPATYPDEPIEIVLVPCAHVDHVTGMIGFNNLDISITSADLRYDCDSGLWLSFERRSQIFLRYAGSIVTSVTINTTEITPSQSSKFDLISHLVRSTQEGRWLTMDEIREEIFGAKTKLSKNQAAGLRARLTDIRNIDRSLVKERKREGCSVLEYQLDADIHTIKL